jgi:radical SAM superfamily enzyme YgiQ (UPF0313 family)
VSEAEWDWAELVLISAMTSQQETAVQIRLAKERGKPVAVGGPSATSFYPELQAAGADYLVLDEGEITLPLWVEALEQGQSQGIFRANGQKTDMTHAPMPRFDLLEMEAYQTMSVQFSRGCPFQCEFCDIIVIYGRKPRTKSPEQLLAELERLYGLGWRAAVMLVDDNLIGNKRNVKRLLTALKQWMADHHYPFWFFTEASIDLAQDPELLNLMAECNFKSVFLGIETPDPESLAQVKKFQNLRHPLEAAVDTITRSGLRVMAGFIMGFDGEKPGAGERIRQFVEATDIPMPQFTMLQALPNTPLWHRLEAENRLLTTKAEFIQTNLINFVPSRPLEDIVREYLDAFGQLYDPLNYLNRTYRHFRKMAPPRHPGKYKLKGVTVWMLLRILLLVFWQQGVVRKTRWQFWWNLGRICWYNPRVTVMYLAICLLINDYIAYHQTLKTQIETQLAQNLAQSQEQQMIDQAIPPRVVVEESAPIIAH